MCSDSRGSAKKMLYETVLAKAAASAGPKPPRAALATTAVTKTSAGFSMPAKLSINRPNGPAMPTTSRDSP